MITLDTDVVSVLMRPRPPERLLEAAGLGLADPDLRIAAIVRAHGTTLVTGNL